MAEKYDVQKESNPKIKNSFEYQKLIHEHQKMEERLDLLDRKKYLTDSEIIERKNVQKIKLSYKDRMQQLLVEHKSM